MATITEYVLTNLVALDTPGVIPMYETPQKVSPRTYHHFLRLNNRRCLQSSVDLQAAGYPSRTLPHFGVWAIPGLNESFQAPDEWCDWYLGKHTWIRFRWKNTWWFSREDHAMLFGLTWDQ